MTDNQQMLEVYLQEYEKLKDEQTQRIGFRDNLLYVTLGVFGTVITFAISNKANYYALLVIPWICLILGWTYLVNDEKITAIGRYIRLNLAPKIKEHTGHTDSESIFGWEIAHRSDNRRKRRKIEQLIVDQITFVFSGIVALIAFWLLVSKPPLAVNLLGGIELIFIIILGIEIIIYADLAKGR
ncbi:integral membrane protein (plasmid) [Calothrix sp. NIES-4071]|nr:integral membrane protein [Calothrix sp. NIES-4071]BAZ65115.1 integral membrane protein [Calothrix sp. NIES-4105]